MIAKLTVDGVVAVLDDEGNWHSKFQPLSYLLNKAFSQIMYPPSPSAGASPFANQARAAAKQLNGELMWPKLDEAEDENAVY